MQEVFEDTVGTSHFVGVWSGQPKKAAFDRLALCPLIREESSGKVLGAGKAGLGALFPDGADADERNYEGYTGNAGPTLQYVYHRAVAAVWLRSEAPHVAAEAGFSALAGLLREELARQGGAAEAAGGGQEGPGQSQLEAAAAEVVKKLAAPGSRVDGGSLADLLETVEDLPTELGGELLASVAAAEEACGRGITDGKTAQALAQALAAASGNQAAVAAVAKLVAAAVGKGQTDLCVALASSEALEGPQASAAREAVLDALFGAVVAKGTLESLKPDALVGLAGLALGQAGQHPAYWETLARAAQSRTRGAALGALAKLVSGRVATDPLAAALVRARAAQLEAAVAAPPPFSWHQPDACLPAYPTVEAFLRGPEKAATFQIFNDLPHARNWARKYSTGGHGANNTYSFTADPGGRGRVAFCNVTKTRAWFDRKAKRLEEAAVELARLREVLAAAAEEVTAESAGPPAATAAGVKGVP